MKIIATVTNADDMMHTGSPLTSRSAIIEISDDDVPAIVIEYFANKKWASEGAGRHSMRTLSFSLFDDRVGLYAETQVPE